MPLIIDDGCKQVAFPFLCQYMFPLCDVSTNDSHGDMLRPSVEECMKIREHLCKKEWILAKESEFGSLLPNCSTLSNGMIILHNWGIKMNVCSISQPLPNHCQRPVRVIRALFVMKMNPVFLLVPSGHKSKIHG